MIHHQGPGSSVLDLDVRPPLAQIEHQGDAVSSWHMAALTSSLVTKSVCSISTREHHRCR